MKITDQRGNWGEFIVSYQISKYVLQSLRIPGRKTDDMEIILKNDGVEVINHSTKNGVIGPFAINDVKWEFKQR